MAQTGLAVLESRWWESGNDSVRPLFETLAGIVEGNPHSVRYDMFVEEASLTRLIADVVGAGDFHSIYIGAHGSENSVSGLGDAEVSRTKLRDMLRTLNASGAVKGSISGSA